MKTSNYIHRIQPDIASVELQRRTEHTYQAKFETVNDRRRVNPKPSLSELEGEWE